MRIVLNISPPTISQKNSVKFNRRTGRTYHEARFVKAREEIKEELKKKAPYKPLDGCLFLTVTLYYPRPKTHQKDVYKATKPDADNALAVYSDLLEKCGYVVNDSRFVLETVVKKYDDGKGARVEIEFGEIEEKEVYI